MPRPSTTAPRSRGWPTSDDTAGSRSRAPRNAGCGRGCSRRRGGPRSSCRTSWGSRRSGWLRVRGSGSWRATACSAASASWWPSRPSSTATPWCRPRLPAGRWRQRLRRPSTYAIPRPSGRSWSACVRSGSSARRTTGGTTGAFASRRPASRRSSRRSRAKAGTSRPRASVYRRPGATSLRVSSGIDWFELEGSGGLRGRSASPCPGSCRRCAGASGRRARRRHRSGCCPEEWLRRQAPLARFGEVEGEAVRFKPSQAGLLDALLAAQPEVETDAAFERARGALRRFEGIGRPRRPERLRGPPARLPGAGLGWLAFLREFGFGGCLADDMGLGKTVQVLALLRVAPHGAASEALARRRAPLARLQLDARRRRASRPRLRVLDHTGLGAGARRATPSATHDLVLTTYGTLRRDAALLEDVDFDYVILDEAQAIKNAATESAKAARLLRADHRLALSGTPVENHLGELWSLFEFLNPGMLGRVALSRRARRASSTRRAAPPSRGRSRPFILRRTKEQVAPDLPAEDRADALLRARAAQQQGPLRRAARPLPRSRCSRASIAQGLGRSKIQVLEALLRLRQAACHPGLDRPAARRGPEREARRAPAAARRGRRGGAQGARLLAVHELPRAR